MSPEYLAGFVDGEGCFFIEKRSGGAKLSIAQKDYSLLEMIQSQWGGTFYHHPKGTSYLTFAGSFAKPIIESILPHLILKRDQASFMLRHLNRSPGRGYNTRLTSNWKTWCMFANNYMKQLKRAA